MCVCYECIIDKYITCSVKKLLQLFGRKCLVDSCTSQIDVDYKISGSCLQVYGCCTSGHRLDWASSDFHLNQNNTRIYNSNLSLVAAIILPDNNFAKMKDLFKFMGMPIVSRTTFFSYQRHFICPAVNKFYIREQVLFQLQQHNYMYQMLFVVYLEKGFSAIQFI